MILLILLTLATVIAGVALGLQRRRRVSRGPRAAGDGGGILHRRRSLPGATVATPEGVIEEIAVGRRRRRFLLYRPEGVGIGTPPPLVLAFHGGFSNPTSFARRTQLNDAASRHGFVVAYPAALGHWADGRETTGLASNDVEFSVRVRDHLLQNVPVDDRRIYAIGSSNGGMFVLRLALEVPELFAGFAATLASLPVGLMPKAAEGPPAPLMMVNAVNDLMIPWLGGHVGRDLGVGGSIIGVEDTVELWRLRNGCGGAQVTLLSDAAMEGEGAAELQDFLPVTDRGARLRFLKLLKGGHSWPTARLVGRGTTDGALIEMAVIDLVWEFLSSHVSGGLARPGGRPEHRPGGLARY